MTTKYTEDHEWVCQQGDMFVVGITDYAQEQLGEIVYVELPAVGADLTSGKEAAVVESVKAAGEVKSPLSGKVTEANDKLADSPQLVNDDPEGEGWFYRMHAEDTKQLDALMDTDDYRKFLDTLG